MIWATIVDSTYCEGRIFQLNIKKPEDKTKSVGCCSKRTHVYCVENVK